MSKNYFYTYEDIDFRHHTSPDGKHLTDFCRDWYDKAFETKNLRRQEYCANRALRINEKIALCDTMNYFKQSDKYEIPIGSFSYADDEDGLYADVPIDIINTEHDLVSNYYVNYDTIPRYEEEVRKQKQINCLLYDTLLKLSKESGYMKTVIAKFLYDSSYDEVLPDDQKDYWLTDFAMLDILESEGRNTDKEIYLKWDNGCTANTKRWQYDAMKKKVQKSVEGFKTMYNMATYNPKKMARVVLPEEQDDYEEESLQEDYEFAVA